LGFDWLDTGTPESLLDASNFIHTIKKLQSLKIACLEEIAFDKKYISGEQLRDLATPLSKNETGEYLMRIVEKKETIKGNFYQLKFFNKGKTLVTNPSYRLPRPSLKGEQGFSPPAPEGGAKSAKRTSIQTSNNKPQTTIREIRFNS